MKSKMVAAVIAAVMAMAAHADDSAANWDVAVSGQAVLGCAISEKPKHGATAVSVTCSRDKVIQEVPLLKKMGMINPEVTQTQINMMPNLIVMVFALEDAGLMVHEYFGDHPGVNETAWTVAIDVPDAYGNLHRQTAFRFNFSRALDRRINWDNFQPKNLESVAPRFSWGEWGQEAMTEGQ